MEAHIRREVVGLYWKGGFMDHSLSQIYAHLSKRFPQISDPSIYKQVILSVIDDMVMDNLF